MKNARFLFILISLFSFIAQALTCKSLFIQPPIQPYSIETDSPRLDMAQITNDGTHSKLFVEESGFSKDVNQAVIEMIRMLSANSAFKLEDKNVLTKNKFTLGVPIKDGYVLELNYESKSNINPRFILQDKIVLITPSGKEYKITDDLLQRDEIKINKSEFDLKDYAHLGRHLKLKAPLVVDGLLLKKFSQLADYFEYFKKAEIANIFKSNSMLQIETAFRLRKAKDVFFNVLVKQPFKFMISGALMFAVMNTQLFVPHHNVVPVAQDQSISAAYIAKTINKLPIPESQPQLKKEYLTLQAELANKVQSHSFSHINFLEIQLDSKNMFSQENNLFIYEKANENTGEKNTYVVFSNDISKNSMVGMQYLIIEIPAFKYANLINYIKNQGKIGTEKPDNAK